MRTNWINTGHESRVERFYGSGVDGFHEYHNGYLNFGLWDRPDMTYEEAAENLIREAGRRLAIGPESDLLDIGCGMGTQDVFLQKAFRPRSIDAVDVTWKHIERAKERVRRSSVPSNSIHFHHASAVKLPFADGRFSHVLSVEAPEHFDTREKFFHEAFRVLKKGGVFLITDYSLARIPQTALDKALVALASYVWCVPKANLYGKGVFESKLNEAGFADVRVDDLSGSVIPGYCVEAGRWESLRDIARIRGLWKGVIGGRFIDWCLYTAYRRGLCEYILVWARKP